MARQIIVLETNPSDGGYISLNYVFWFAVPVGHEVTKPQFVSQAKGSAAPNAAELTALQNGTVLEFYRSQSFSNTFTAAQIKAELQAEFASQQAYINSLPNINQYYGVFFDSVNGWSA